MVKKIVLWALVIGCMLMIFSFSSQSSEESQELSDSFLDRIILFLGDLVKADEEAIAQWQVLIRKIAHFAVYALLGFLVYLLMHVGYEMKMKISVLLSPVFSGVYALTDEMHQLFVSGRSGQLLDVAIDFSGAVAGSVFAFLICILLVRRRKNG